MSEYWRTSRLVRNLNGQKSKTNSSPESPQVYKTSITHEETNVKTRKYANIRNCVIIKSVIKTVPDYSNKYVSSLSITREHRGRNVGNNTSVIVLLLQTQLRSSSVMLLQQHSLHTKHDNQPKPFLRVIDSGYGARESSFLCVFYSLSWPWPCTKNARGLLLSEQLTNRNVSVT